jgi:hypothetical protein
MACFSGRHVGFTSTEYDLEQWTDDSWGNENRIETAFDSILEKIMDHGQDEYIVSVHWLKLTLAVREEVAELAEPEALLLTAALNRFLNSPLKLKQVRRTAHQASMFISK